MTDHDERVGRQAANLVRHLNGQHASTVLLLARHAPGGTPEATAAALTGLDEDSLKVTALTPDGTAGMRLPLPEGPDARSRIAALLEQVRAGLPDHEPLTSLEQQLAQRGGGGHR